MSLDWEIIDCRARVSDGCYYITLARDRAEQGAQTYVARFCKDGAHFMSEGSSSYGVDISRRRGIGHSTDLGEVKRMCELDADKR
jgi:hypothetical protein